MSANDKDTLRKGAVAGQGKVPMAAPGAPPMLGVVKAAKKVDVEAIVDHLHGMHGGAFADTWEKQLLDLRGAIQQAERGAT